MTFISNSLSFCSVLGGRSPSYHQKNMPGTHQYVVTLFPMQMQCLQRMPAPQAAFGVSSPKKMAAQSTGNCTEWIASAAPQKHNCIEGPKQDAPGAARTYPLNEAALECRQQRQTIGMKKKTNIYTKTASNRNEISEQLAPVSSTKLHTVLAAAASNRNEK